MQGPASYRQACCPCKPGTSRLPCDLCWERATPENVNLFGPFRKEASWRNFDSCDIAPATDQESGDGFVDSMITLLFRITEKFTPSPVAHLFRVRRVVDGIVNVRPEQRLLSPRHTDLISSS